MTPNKIYNALLAQKLITEFEKRNISGFYCESKEAATQLALDMIPKGSSVSWGGSLTLNELGLKAMLKEKGYNVLDPDDAPDIAAKERVAHEAQNADYFLMSSNAISATGELVNADGIGNRVSSLIFGPKNIIVIAGMNKVEPDLDSAIRRVKDFAAPRAVLTYMQGYSTFDELSQAAEAACSHLVITSRSVFRDRIKVILVEESLGY